MSLLLFEQYLHYFSSKISHRIKVNKDNKELFPKNQNHIITSVIFPDNSDCDSKMIIKRLLSLPLN
jgi:hypothetical protein